MAPVTTSPGSRRSARRRTGDRAEQLAAEYLAGLGWSLLARNVPVGRDEIDLIAVEPADPPDPPVLVFVEVRSHATSRFGAPEEGVRARKVANVYRAALGLVLRGQLPDGAALPRLAWRVDLLAVDGFPSIGDGAGGPRVRHLRGVIPE